MGALPEKARWIRLEVPLRKIVKTGSTADGIACGHTGGRVWWGESCIVTDTGKKTILGQSLMPAREELARTRIHVQGLEPGRPVKVLFEDRKIRAGKGYFEDDFRGTDLYQRFGGRGGYGSQPVEFHVYEIP